MTITTIEAIGGHVGEEVEVRGWVYNLRSSGAIHFLLLRDGTELEIVGHIPRSRYRQKTPGP